VGNPSSSILVCYRLREHVLRPQVRQRWIADDQQSPGRVEWVTGRAADGMTPDGARPMSARADAVVGHAAARPMRLRPPMAAFGRSRQLLAGFLVGFVSFE